MFFGVAFYSLIIGLVSAFFRNTDTKNSILQKKLSALQELCKEMKVEDSIFQEIKKAAEYSANKRPYSW